MQLSAPHPARIAVRDFKMTSNIMIDNDNNNHMFMALTMNKNKKR